MRFREAVTFYSFDSWVMLNLQTVMNASKTQVSVVKASVSIRTVDTAAVVILATVLIPIPRGAKVSCN